MRKKISRPCGMCLNASVDPELDHDFDFSSRGIGLCDPGLRMMYQTGNGQATEILVERWDEKNGWLTVGFFRPAYCPICGRFLKENMKYGVRRAEDG